MVCLCGLNKLIGGNGTEYNEDQTDATYARIDKEGEPGYLTDIEKSYKNITIPEGAVLSQFEGEYENTDKGIVIYVMKDADEDGNIDEPDWTNKYQMQKTYDQFVWVPVKNAVLDLSSEYTNLDDDGIKSKIQEQIDAGKYPMAIKINIEGDYVGVLYEFSEVTENNNTYVKVIPYSSWTPKSAKNREPAGLTGKDTETNLKTVNTILNTSYNSSSSFESALQSQYNEMAKKVEENGGFWVGRYETSSMNTSQVSIKRGAFDGIKDITWFRMYAVQKKYSELALENKINSCMICGSQWDQIMIWMKNVENDQDTTGGKYYVTNGAQKGYYTDLSILPYTGREDTYAVRNIFDLVGNLYEWTLEASGTGVRVKRGGYYGLSGSSARRPDLRTNVDMNFGDSSSFYGSRCTLY